MKKVAILTIFNNYNYGNRLQNFAVQTVLNKLDVEACTLETKAGYGEFLTKFNPNLKLVKEKVDKELFEKKERVFKKFNEQYLVTYNNVLNKDNISNYLDDLDTFDYFVVGSDQVWNYNIKTISELNFLTFTADSKKVAYAASLCVDYLPKNIEKYYRDSLSSFKAISVREEKAKLTLTNLLNKDITTVLEPVLMVDRGEWERMIKAPIEKLRKYILVCVLDKTLKSHELFVEKYAREKKLDIIRLCDVNDPKHFACNPNEYLYLVKNAEYIVTDTYHTGIFSIIFNIKCRLYKRKSQYSGMNCRLDTIEWLLNLSKLTHLIKTEDYFEFLTKVDIYSLPAIARAKEETMKFLKNALDIEEHIDVLSENGEKTGLIKSREQVHKDGDWHRTVHIWIYNKKGEILLQRRASNKDNHPNMLSISCAGHLSAGQSSIECALSELKEELNLDVKREDLKLIKTLKRSFKEGNLSNNELCDMYIYNMNDSIDKKRFNRDEISELVLLPFDRFKEMVIYGHRDLKIHEETFEILCKLLDKKHG